MHPPAKISLVPTRYLGHLSTGLTTVKDKAGDTFWKTAF